MTQFPSVEVTLPWEGPSSVKRHTARLIITNSASRPITRSAFNSRHWAHARRLVGIPASRMNGMHALRHYYASVRAHAGENIKAISEDLGHADPAFTLRLYMHLMPGTQDRTRTTIDDLYRLEDTARPGDGLVPVDGDESPGRSVS